MSIEKMKRLIDRFPVISFDIYDTLVLRPYAKPVDLHIHMEQLYKIKDFAYYRLIGEQKARSKHNDLEDITFDMIYMEMDGRYARMQSCEAQLEVKLAMPNPEMREIYEYAKANGKRVILITDMYLPRETITAMLFQNGFAGYERLYISSECGKMKHTGNLFRHAFADFGVNSKDVLHIGDTVNSDIEGARSCGATAYHYPKIIERLYDNNPRAQAWHDRNRISHGVSVVLGVLALSHFRPKKEYWWEFGYNYAGPVIYAFMCWLRREVIQKEIKKVLFVARDGYTPKKVFDILCKADGIESAYIYAPRNVTALTTFDYRQRNQHDPVAALATVKLIIEYYSEKVPEIARIAPRKVTSVEEGMSFIDANKDLFARAAAEKAADYGDYILPILPSGKVALVDTLSIHLSSQKLLQKYAPRNNCTVEGFYWCLVDDSFIDSLTVSAFQPERHWLTYDWDLFEFFMTAPEPSIKDFSQGKPVYLPFAEEEKYRHEVYPNLSEGAVEFAKNAIEALKGLDPFISNADVTDWANVLCSHPTEEDREMVWKIKHMYDPNVNIFKPICKPWFSVSKSVTTYKLFKIFKILNIERQITDDKKSISICLFGLPLYQRIQERGVIKHLFLKRRRNFQ